MPVRGTGRDAVLLDAGGREIARFRHDTDHGREIAGGVVLLPGVELEEAVAVIRAELPGWRIAGSAELGHALLAGGAHRRRHVLSMARDLVRDPPPPEWLDPPLPPGFRLAPADRDGAALAPAHVAAYGPDHPDYALMRDPEHPAAELDELLDGRAMGPLLSCSALAVRDDGGVAGAVLANASPVDGPWITEIFRHPEARGVGVPLLRHALAAAARDGVAAIGLAVSHGNTGARRLYAEHGFGVDMETLSVEL